MKKLQTFLGLALCGVLLNCSFTASAQPGKPGFATVVRVEGIAKYCQDGVHTNPLVPGKFLEKGAVIITGDDGVVDVVLAKAIDLPQAKWVPERISLAVDSPVRGMISYKPSAEQNVVRLMPNTILVIDKLTTPSEYGNDVTDTELNLEKGRIFASVKTIKDPTVMYLIKTPTGAAAVKGTQLSLELNPDGTIKRCAVYAGLGVLLAPNGLTPTFDIGPGQMWEPGDPSPVSIPAALMDFFQLAFSSVRTIYYEIVNYDYDHTKVLESTDYGF
jgi:hypothetical protein